MADRLFAATRKGLFELHRKGANNWDVARISFLGSPVTTMLADARDGTLYTALNLGHFGVKLHRSDNDGASWTEISAPSYTGVDADQPDPPSLNLLWSLETGSPAEPGVLWAGTIPGGLFRSDNRGDSWLLNEALWNEPSRPEWFGGGYDKPGIHSISLDPRDGRRIAIAISCGGVWETTDGGQSWKLSGDGLIAAYMPPDQQQNRVAQDPHRLVRCRAEPDAMWIQHHNGIFHSTTGVDGWSQIETVVPSFGFAVAVHPEKPGTAWFAPAVKDEYRYPRDGRLVVTRTTDGGQSFDTLTEGLPQTHAYDLVYRHGLEVDESGERLVMGSTSGGLWFSENGGDSWAQSPFRLPPIYAVRYA